MYLCQWLWLLWNLSVSNNMGLVVFENNNKIEWYLTRCFFERRIIHLKLDIFFHFLCFFFVYWIRRKVLVINYPHSIKSKRKKFSHGQQDVLQLSHLVENLSLFSARVEFRCENCSNCLVISSLQDFRDFFQDFQAFRAEERSVRKLRFKIIGCSFLVSDTDKELELLCSKNERKVHCGWRESGERKRTIFIFL